MVKRGKEKQRGMALVLALLAIALLAFVGIGMSLASGLAAQTTTNYDESISLANASESALELAARELALVDIGNVLSGSQVSSLVDGMPGPRTIAPNVTIDLQQLTNELTCGRAGACTAAQASQSTAERPWGTNNPQWRLFIHQPLAAPSIPRATPAYIVVWIGDDASEDDGDPTMDGAGPGGEGRYIVRVRAEAFGPRGGRHAIEAELARLCVPDPSGDVCLPGSRVQSWRSTSALIP